VIGVIDSDIDLLQALPCLLAHKRYMYSNTAMYITLQHYHQGRQVYYHDIKANTDMLRQALKVLIKEYAPRFPLDKLERLFEDRMRLTAEECKAYGLVDEIIEPFMRDLD
jgi:ATP-dependent protease ClpP protease subunit